MHYFIAGVPSPFTEWCKTVILDLLRSSTPESSLLSVRTPIELTLAQMGKADGTRLVCLTCPTGTIIAALGQSGRYFLLIADDWKNSLAYLALNEGLSFNEAIRNVASIHNAQLELQTRPNSLTLFPSDSAAEISCKLTAFLGVATESPRFNAPSDFEETAVSDWWSSLAPSWREAACGAICSADGNRVKFKWVPQLFEGGGSEIDITGRARTLFKGPEIVVPSGNWRIKIPFTISGGAVEHGFSLIMTAGNTLQKHILSSRRTGEQLYEFCVTLDDSASAPFSLEVALQRAAFDGKVKLGPVELTKETGK